MIKIVSDSTAYLPEEKIREYDVHVVPLLVHFGEQEFKEQVELTNEEFYARLKAAPELPTTSQPSAGDFYQVFRELHDAGHQILCVTISSKLSGTWNSAMAAKDMLPEAHIQVVDSLSVSIGLQLIIEAAGRAIQNGASIEQAVAVIEQVQSGLQVLFVVDTLEYLAKGGRIGNAKAFMGTMLKVKPILKLHEGKLEPVEQVRTKRKALSRMLDMIQEGLDTRGAQAKVALTHALVPDQAAEIRDEIVARLGCPPPSLADLGPVIGTHTGPGVVGVAAYA